MSFTVYETTNEVEDMEVLVDVCPAEPDIGLAGNGNVAISILDVRKLDRSILDELSEQKIDDLAAQIYSTHF